MTDTDAGYSEQFSPATMRAIEQVKAEMARDAERSKRRRANNAAGVKKPIAATVKRIEGE